MPDTPKLREALRGIPEYKPGKGGTTYKLSANESPYPPLPGVLDAAVRAAGTGNRYPDMGCVDLIAEIARTFDVPPAHVAPGVGSIGVLQQLLQATSGPGDEVVYAWRSFEAYPILTRISGAERVEVPLADERHDLDAMAAAITPRTRLVIVCNPNNPTGTVVRREELVRFLDGVPSDVLVVLDEAYGEFITDADVPDGLELYRDRPNVAVLRTFSKAYGLAGYRVGFAVAHEPVARGLRQTALPFGVTQVGQDAAIASLRSGPELKTRVDALVAERERVVAGLAEAGWKPPETQANFVWLRLGDATTAFADACVHKGLAVRPYAGEGVRVTVGEPEANDLFLDVAREFSR